MSSNRSASIPVTPSELGRSAGGRPDATAAGCIIFFLFAAVLDVLVPFPARGQVTFGHAMLIAAPLVAAWSCARAGGRRGGAARLSWWCFAAGSVAVVAGQLLWAARQVVRAEPGGFPVLSFVLFQFFHLAYATGVLLALRPARSRGQGVSIALDGGLILVAAVMLVDRFVLVPVLQIRDPDAIHLAPILASQATGILSVLFAGLLILWGDPMLPARSVPAIAGTTGAFLLGNVMVAAGVDPRPATPGDPFDVVWLAGWGLLAIGGLMGQQDASAPAVTGAMEAARRRLRQAVVPGAALFLGASAVDAAMHPTGRPEMAIAGGLLGVLLAVRIGYALRAAEHQVEERRKLEQTRALVELSRALAAATELQRTLELVAQWACRLLRARAGGIELLTDDGTTLEMRAVYGLPRGILGLRFPVESSFTGQVVKHGRPRATADPGADPYVQPQSLTFLGSLPAAAAPLHFGERRLGALFVSNRDQAFDAAELELLCALADQAALAIGNAQLFEQVHALSLTDPLTGLANRRQLERDLEREFAAARRGRRLVLVLFDLDNFKEYNDRYGHLAGDEVLRIFGRVLGVETRAMNLAARYGGDEFLALLTESAPGGAALFVERVAAQFAQEMERLGRGRVTVSAGIAEYRQGMECGDDLIAAADRDLYQSKDSRTHV